MATTGVVKGNGILVYVGGTAIACTTDGSVDHSYEEIDATCKDSDGVKAILLGQQSATFSVSGLMQFDATYGIEDLRSIFDAGNTVVILWSTESAGDQSWSATCYMTQLQESAGLNGVAEWSCTFTSTGAVTLATIT
jgi:hypothetical protein